MTSMPNSAPVRVTYHGRLYDIPRDFVDNEHPGGADSIYPYEGSDMTEAFEDVGHSKDAVAMLTPWMVEGQEPVTSVVAATSTAADTKPQTCEPKKGNGAIPTTAVPWLVAIGCAVGVYIVLTQRRGGGSAAAKAVVAL
jgi:cytochrome b involved in lipid metabolism